MRQHRTGVDLATQGTQDLSVEVIYRGSWRITMVPVKSSNVAAVGYERDAQILAVRFKGGKTYAYHAVPAFVYERLVVAPSKGKYLAKHVVGNLAYEYEVIG